MLTTAPLPELFEETRICEPTVTVPVVELRLTVPPLPAGVPVVFTPLVAVMLPSFTFTSADALIVTLPPFPPAEIAPEVNGRH